MAKKNSTVKNILIGCGVLAFLALVVVGVGIYFIVGNVSDMKDSMENPLPLAQETLGVETLPEGYYAHAAVDAFWMMQMVMLTDTPREDSNNPGSPLYQEHAFIYFSLRLLFPEEKKNDLRKFIQGDEGNTEALSDAGVNVNVNEILNRGSFEYEGRNMYYMTFRGDSDLSATNQPNLTTLFLIDCREDTTFRVGLWMGNDPNPQAAAADLDLTGTVGDLEKVRAFIDHFSFCPQ